MLCQNSFCIMRYAIDLIHSSVKDKKKNSSYSFRWQDYRYQSSDARLLRFVRSYRTMILSTTHHRIVVRHCLPGVFDREIQYGVSPHKFNLFLFTTCGLNREIVEVYSHWLYIRRRTWCLLWDGQTKCKYFVWSQNTAIGCVLCPLPLWSMYVSALDCAGNNSNIKWINSFN